MRNDENSLPLADTELGDIVVLPDGRGLTARARVLLPSSTGSMAGFVICGEMEVLLGIPPTPHGPVNIYLPVNYIPASAAESRTVHEGSTSYWAPHLPSITGAMGEILYRVVEIRGSVDPIVIVYRNAEVIVFIRATFESSDRIKLLKMPRTNNDHEVTRHAGIVDAPVAAPEPAAPIRLPARRRRTLTPAR